MLALVAVAAFAGCERLERFPQQLFDTRTPRERYEEALAAAGMGSTALVRDWLSAAERALAEAALVTSPHEEQGFLDPREPAAFAFRVSAQRGQEVSFVMELAGPAGQVFLEAWQVSDDSLRLLRRVAVSDSGSAALVFEPRRGGEYVLRAQPELLRGGRFRVAVRIGPSLGFPVPAAGDGDIGGAFGAPRDGGARSHEGVDIFARRGSAAVATGPATVRRVGENGLGGLIVWLRDERGNSLYYAHLDTQLVVEGQQVRAGDTVGLVGRTGNARRTPAHLHFGVYRRGEGPLNPYWFVARPGGVVPRLTADTSLLGRWARTPGPAVIQSAPSRAAPARDTVPRFTALQLLAAVGSWYHVRLPDGATGYVPAARIVALERGVETMRLERGIGMARRPRPADDADVEVVLAAGDIVTVLGRYGSRLLVRTAGGLAGWIEPVPPAAAAD